VNPNDVQGTSKPVRQIILTHWEALRSAVQAVEAIVQCPDLHRDQILLMMCVVPQMRRLANQQQSCS
jgi:hypothetical protein